MSSFLYILSLAAIGLAFYAQFKVKRRFKKWSNESALVGLTGAQVVRQILDRNGLHHVKVEPIPGELNDHYDPIHRSVRLSEPVYESHSIAAISVAAHECGHAIQHKETYGALVLRHRMFPIVNFTSGLAPILLLIGILFKIIGLFLLGFLFFAATVVFQVVNLPVEFNASNRAKQILITEGFIQNNEIRGVKKVLNAAALTYVAVALYAVIELLRFISIILGSKDDD